MPALDAPTFSPAALKRALDGSDDESEDEIRGARRESPLDHNTIQQCVQCERWGNIDDRMYDRASYSKRGLCSECKKPDKNAATAQEWATAFEEGRHVEVAMLQKALLEDHKTFLTHLDAWDVIERNRTDARRVWLTALAAKVALSTRTPGQHNSRVQDNRSERAQTFSGGDGSDCASAGEGER